MKFRLRFLTALLTLISLLSVNISFAANIQGPPGPQGPRGLTGPQGPPNGNTIWNGSGAPSVDLTSQDGDFYIDTTAKKIYGPKANGAWPGSGWSLSIVGPKGDAGTNGTSGNSIFNGSGAPSNIANSKNGDFYIDTTAHKLYGPKANGTWPGSGLNLVGPVSVVGTTNRITVSGNTIDIGSKVLTDDSTHTLTNKSIAANQLTGSIAPARLSATTVDATGQSTTGYVPTITGPNTWSWQAQSGGSGGGSGFANPMSALGDLIYGGASGTATRIAGNITATKKFFNQTGNGTVSAAPTWNALVSADLPIINLASSTNGGVTGTLPIANGGTGLASVGATSGQIPTSDGAGHLVMQLPSDRYNTLGSQQDPSYYVAYRTALMKTLVGTADTNMLCLGDSTTRGNGATSALTAYPGRLVELFKSHGVKAAEGMISVGWMSNDSRVTVGTNWISTGGFMYQTGGGTAITFAPDYEFDRIRIYYASNGGKGTVTVNVDGGASLGTADGNATAALHAQTFTVTRGTHTLNIVPASGDFLLVGFECSNTADKCLRIHNLGADATTVANWTDTSAAYNPFYYVGLLQPNLTVANLTINDAGFGTTTESDYRAKLQQLVAEAKNYGDVLVMSGVPSAGSTAAEPFVGFAKDIAKANNCGFVDLYHRWVSHDASSALYADSLHPNDAGYFDNARAVFKALDF